MSPSFIVITLHERKLSFTGCSTYKTTNKQQTNKQGIGIKQDKVTTPIDKKMQNNT